VKQSESENQGHISPDRGRVNEEETGENKEGGGKKEMPDNLGGLNNHNLKQMVDKHRRELQATVDKIEDAGKPVPGKLERALDELKD